MPKPLLEELTYNVVRPLLASGNPAIEDFTRRDLLGEDTGPILALWDLPQVRALLKKQQPDGSFPYTGTKKPVKPDHHYLLVETFRRSRLLVKRYGLTMEDEGMRKAAEYIFSCQTEDGDFRGFIGYQYATYYTGAILALLVRAGLEDDSRVEKGMQWLLSMRQDDGGWTIPILTHDLDGATTYDLTSGHGGPVEPDRTKPFSHNWANMVLEAFAAHPRYRGLAEARRAGELLKSRFFRADVYASYREARYWVRFIHWWPNLLLALDSLARLGFTTADPDIRAGIDWFTKNQREDGLWDLENDGNYRPLKEKEREDRLWLALDICRMLRRYS